MTIDVRDHPGVPARQAAFNAAIVAYRAQTGSAPISLVSLTPVLETLTRSKCCVVRVSEVRYRVWEGLDRQKTEVFDVDYKLGSNGFRETCHVYNIRAFYHRE